MTSHVLKAIFATWTVMLIFGVCSDVICTRNNQKEHVSSRNARRHKVSGIMDRREVTRVSSTSTEAGFHSYNDDYNTEADNISNFNSTPSQTESSYENDGLPQSATYVPFNCSACQAREELKQLSLQAIKEQILSKLGMKQTPNITGRQPPRIPPLDYLLDHYGMQGDGPGNTVFKPGTVFEDEEDDFHAKTEKMIAFAQFCPKNPRLPRGYGRIQRFSFSEKIRRKKVIKAYLWLYVRSSHPQDTTTKIDIYKVERPGKGESPIFTQVRSTKIQPVPENGKWVTLELKKQVADWFRHPSRNLGIIVQSGLDRYNREMVVSDPDEGDGSHIPFIEVYMTDGRKHRTKRTIGLNCNDNSEEKRCCRYPLTVDFEGFGWDWIIAPKKYKANYCSGDCPYVFLQKYPHTHIVQQANPAGTAGPCCAPRKMSPISMLYFDTDFNIIYSLLPGMIVDRCGCS